MSSHPEFPNSAKEFRDRFAKGGYSWTIAVDQRLAATLAPIAIRRHLTPNDITLSYCVLGVIVSLIVALAPNDLIAGAVGFVGWQFAYILDCLDGQIARATDQASPQGGVLDALCDFVVHVALVAAVLFRAVEHIPTKSQWALAVFLTAGGVIAPYFSGVVSLLEKGEERSRPLLIRILNFARDYGMQVAVVSICLAVDNRAALLVLGIVAVLDFGALAMQIVAFGMGKRTGL